MKLMAALFVFTFSIVAQAGAVKFPTWVTDDRAKVWAVNKLIEFMADDEFYKIRNIEVKRDFDQENNYDYLKVTLTFDDPSCASRRVYVSAFAPLCDEDSCYLNWAMTDCGLTDHSKKEVNKTVLRSH